MLPKADSVSWAHCAQSPTRQTQISSPCFQALSLQTRSRRIPKSYDIMLPFHVMKQTRYLSSAQRNLKTAFRNIRNKPSSSYRPDQPDSNPKSSTQLAQAEQPARKRNTLTRAHISFSEFPSSVPPPEPQSQTRNTP